MQTPSGNKNASGLELDTSSRANGSDEAYQLEIAAMLGDESIDLDDALDDENENPVGHSLTEAAENSGPREIRDVWLEKN